MTIHAPNCDWHYDHYEHECTCVPPNQRLFCAGSMTKHDWHELTDENNQLVEPAQDICVSCGEKR